ncbi:Rho GTPase activation protein [Fimicolochytrium jonesii]|uniref:Rho GTPase activation protein n=1 Tax=Fimicolochytrium jonesii TaxID=1396493 RepID=UPI0022FDC73A|nr:Rho GTPase activation protein [Fimicolochytrium jonesii]KAI8822932.1 Rho GTPase activation protein [Fimicolochytrium jonesii]
MSSQTPPSPRAYRSLPRPPRSSPSISLRSEGADDTFRLPRRPVETKFRRSDETPNRDTQSESNVARSGTNIEGSPSPSGDWWGGISKWTLGRLKGRRDGKTNGGAVSSEDVSEHSADDSTGSTPENRPTHLAPPSQNSYGPRSASLELIRVFGVPLPLVLERESERTARAHLQSEFVIPRRERDPYAHAVPLVVRACAAWLENTSITKEGLYRVPGSLRRVAAYQEQIDTGTFDYIFPAHESPHTVASLLKKFISSIPGGIWGGGDVQIRLKDAVKRLTPSEYLICLTHTLPTPFHFSLLRYITRHFNRIQRHADENKMTAENLAISIFPGMDSVAEFLITNWDSIFSDQPLPQQQRTRSDTGMEAAGSVAARGSDGEERPTSIKKAESVAALAAE